jgi:hypothetical protein
MMAGGKKGKWGNARGKLEQDFYNQEEKWRRFDLSLRWETVLIQKYFLGVPFLAIYIRFRQDYIADPKLATIVN